MIARRSTAFTPARTGSPAGAVAVEWPGHEPFEGAEPAKWLEELKLFATGWIGGLIFFGTYLS